MNQREALIKRYERDLKDYFNVSPNNELLTQIAIGCGPSIYNRDSSTISATDESELERVKTNFLMGKLGLEEGVDFDTALASILETYGKTNRTKYRVVVYYVLTVHFNKESVYI